MSTNEEMDIDASVLIGKKRDRNEDAFALDEEEAKRVKNSTLSAIAIADKSPDEAEIYPSNCKATSPAVITSHSALPAVASYSQKIDSSSEKIPSAAYDASRFGVPVSRNGSCLPVFEIKKQAQRPVMNNNVMPVPQSTIISEHQEDSIGAEIESNDPPADNTASTKDLTHNAIELTPADTITAKALAQNAIELTPSQTLTAKAVDRKSPSIKIILGFLTMFILNTATTVVLLDVFLSPLAARTVTPRHHPHIIPPSEASYVKRKRRSMKMTTHDEMTTHDDELSNVTLRSFLSDSNGFHLGLAPSFFGYYVYFGALTAFHEEMELEKDRTLLPVDLDANTRVTHESGPEVLLRSVSGASSGAMAAVLLAAGLNPRESADFASTMTVDKFWDFPGFGGAIKGDLFEEIMVDRLKQSGLAKTIAKGGSLQLEDGLIPVAVSGFDIFALEGKVMTKGCMGKAARASATFPGLFQPCQWNDHGDDPGNDATVNNDTTVSDKRHRYLIDGGMADMYGLVGLGHLRIHEKNKRVVNLVAGTFGKSRPPIGPSNLPKGIDASEVVSISIEGTPQCGPWAMQNGPRAVEAARKAVIDILDAPMYHGLEEGHYILHVDASAFVPN